MIFKMLALLGLIIPALASEGTYVRYGLGFHAPSQTGLSETKYFSVGHQSEILKYFEQQFEGGTWIDSSHKDGRKSNAFGSYQLGVEPKIGHFYVQSMHGVALVTNKDSTLGSNYQFVHDVGLGVGDSRGVRLGIGYKHFSNAGLQKPNRGRDFFGFRIQIPW